MFKETNTSKTNNPSTKQTVYNTTKPNTKENQAYPQTNQLKSTKRPPIYTQAQIKTNKQQSRQTNHQKTTKQPTHIHPTAFTSNNKQSNLFKTHFRQVATITQPKASKQTIKNKLQSRNMSYTNPKPP